MRFKKYLMVKEEFVLETKVLKQPTVDKINAMAKDQKLKSIVKKIFAYGGKGNEGYGLARITTINLMNDIVTEIAHAFEAGKSFNLKAELAKKKYDKVTDPYDSLWREYATIIYNNLYGK